MAKPTGIYDFDPHNLPREYLEAIGLLVVAASNAEAELGYFLSGVLGIDNIQQAALTEAMPAPLKNRIMRALIEIDAPSIEIIDEIDDILDDVFAGLDKRNTVAHASFARDPKTNKVFMFKIRVNKGLIASWVPISVEEIREDSAFLYKASFKLSEFMVRRGISVNVRTSPLNETIVRTKQAREARRNKKP